jgi:DNA-binding NtrC family response regulator
MQEVINSVKKVALYDTAVLIEGESGTGKELVARALHDLSPRSNGPYHVINCASIPESLQASAYFGHVRGAFSDATESRAGAFRSADGGTLFLDEIGDTGPSTQAALLRAVESGEITPVGTDETFWVNTRLITATNRPVTRLIEQAQFREDFFFRIAGYRIAIPPLRDRRADIEPLVAHFLSSIAGRMGRAIPRIADRAIDVLREYHWPGNVRELRNVVERILIASCAELIDVDALPIEVKQASVMTTVATSDACARAASLRDVERADRRRRYEEALRVCDGKRVLAARVVGVPRSTFCRQCRELGL